MGVQNIQNFSIYIWATAAAQPIDLHLYLQRKK